MVKISNLIMREIKLMIRELKDGCNDCTKLNMCNKHIKLVNHMCTKPKEYILLVKTDDGWKVRRIKELE